MGRAALRPHVTKSYKIIPRHSYAFWTTHNTQLACTCGGAPLMGCLTTKAKLATAKAITECTHTIWETRERNASAPVWRSENAMHPHRFEGQKMQSTHTGLKVRKRNAPTPVWRTENALHPHRFEGQKTQCAHTGLKVTSVFGNFSDPFRYHFGSMLINVAPFWYHLASFGRHVGSPLGDESKEHNAHYFFYNFGINFDNVGPI